MVGRLPPTTYIIYFLSFIFMLKLIPKQPNKFLPLHQQTINIHEEANFRKGLVEVFKHLLETRPDKKFDYFDPDKTEPAFLDNDWHQEFLEKFYDAIQTDKDFVETYQTLAKMDAEKIIGYGLRATYELLKEGKEPTPNFWKFLGLSNKEVETLFKELKEGKNFDDFSGNVKEKLGKLIDISNPFDTPIQRVGYYLKYPIEAIGQGELKFLSASTFINNIFLANEKGALIPLMFVGSAKSGKSYALASMTKFVGNKLFEGILALKSGTFDKFRENLEKEIKELNFDKELGVDPKQFADDFAKAIVEYRNILQKFNPKLDYAMSIQGMIEPISEVFNNSEALSTSNVRDALGKELMTTKMDTFKEPKLIINFDDIRKSLNTQQQLNHFNAIRDVITEDTLHLQPAIGITFSENLDERFSQLLSGIYNSENAIKSRTDTLERYESRRPLFYYVGANQYEKSVKIPKPSFIGKSGFYANYINLVGRALTDYVKYGKKSVKNSIAFQTLEKMLLPYLGKWNGQLVKFLDDLNEAIMEKNYDGFVERSGITASKQMQFIADTYKAIRSEIVNTIKNSPRLNILVKSGKKDLAKTIVSDSVYRRFFEPEDTVGDYAQLVNNFEDGLRELFENNGLEFEPNITSQAFEEFLSTQYSPDVFKQMFSFDLQVGEEQKINFLDNRMLRILRSIGNSVNEDIPTQIDDYLQTLGKLGVETPDQVKEYTGKLLKYIEDAKQNGLYDEYNAIKKGDKVLKNIIEEVKNGLPTIEKEYGKEVKDAYMEMLKEVPNAQPTDYSDLDPAKNPNKFDPITAQIVKTFGDVNKLFDYKQDAEEYSRPSNENWTSVLSKHIENLGKRLFGEEQPEKAEEVEGGGSTTKLPTPLEYHKILEDVYNIKDEEITKEFQKEGIHIKPKDIVANIDRILDKDNTKNMIDRMNYIKILNMSYLCKYTPKGLTPSNVRKDRTIAGFNYLLNKLNKYIPDEKRRQALQTHMTIGLFGFNELSYSLLKEHGLIKESEEKKAVSLEGVAKHVYNRIKNELTKELYEKNPDEYLKKVGDILKEAFNVINEARQNNPEIDKFDNPFEALMYQLMRTSKDGEEQVGLFDPQQYVKAIENMDKDEFESDDALSLISRLLKPFLKEGEKDIIELNEDSLVKMVEMKFDENIVDGIQSGIENVFGKENCEKFVKSNLGEHIQVAKGSIADKCAEYKNMYSQKIIDGMNSGKDIITKLGIMEKMINC